MTATASLPLPPMQLRALVGPRDDQDFDNPSGQPIYPHLPASAYRSVFDFGCGCGRLARRLIQQTPRPDCYIGVDPHPELIAWARQHLSPAAPGFAFHHHDVYSPGYAPNNQLRLAEPFPVQDGSVTLAIAHSVFTHLSLDQTVYYLGEVRRALAPDGVAFTSWFFFDNASFPFLPEGPYALYASEKDFSAAVVYDRHWFVKAVRQSGLTVVSTRQPEVPGHQWEVWLAPRTQTSVDQFPLNADGAEFVCGATFKPMATRPDDPEKLNYGKTGSRAQTADEAASLERGAPRLYGPLADLFRLRHDLSLWRRRALGYRIVHKLARLVRGAR